MKKILVSGGAGFIGSALVRYLINCIGASVLVVDKLTYAGNLDSLDTVEQHPHYHFIRADICDADAMAHCFMKFQPDAVMHLAAESHVDRSISAPSAFLQTNIMGTFSLLQAARSYWEKLEAERKRHFRFLHVSTDEVFGDLHGHNERFTEETAYAPSSPYSASKAASDHLVRAWTRTYGLPCLVSNCSNNYGPFQFPEKLIPLMILNAISGKQLPVYGQGHQIRDWLFVDDHVKALYKVLSSGVVGETYAIGGHNEWRNIDVVNKICDLLGELAPQKPSGVKQYHDLITHVVDRPGHDLRYAIDASKIQRELNWTPEENFDSGLRKTVQWYLSNREWWQRVQSGEYQQGASI